MKKFFINQQDVKYHDYFKFEDHIYRGQMKMDASSLEPVKHGYGHLIYRDNEVDNYIGYFEDNKFSGFGMLQKDERTSIYVGFFKDMRYHGNGMLLKDDGTFYKGEFKEGNKHGYGLYIDSPARQFFGQFEEDVKTGNGREETIYLDMITYYVGKYFNNERSEMGLYQ
jgi:hypothetical protein